MNTPPEDDGRTVLHGVAPTPGDASPQPADRDDGSHALPVGTRLHEFELMRRLGEGGFSVVYLAWDHSLDRKVALKEYMPSGLATRYGTILMRPSSERHRETYEVGLKSFINEAKLLARFDHPALVKVYRFWEANGTAYLVMPLYDGVTLKEALRGRDVRPDEAWLRGFLQALANGLGVIHAESCYHRDIAPDNILLLNGSSRPLLLDFGAARRVIGDMTQAFTVILKPGFAPLEQYAEVPGMKQGPWTDVYALAATVYWIITGRTPPPAVGRVLHDSYEPLAQIAAGRYGERFLAAIDRALAIRPDGRTRSIAALLEDLGPGEALPPVLAARAPADPDATVIRVQAASDAPDVPAEPASGASVVQASRPAPARPRASSRGRPILPVVLGVGALSLVVAAAWWLRPVPSGSDARPPVIAAPSSSAAASQASAASMTDASGSAANPAAAPVHAELPGRATPAPPSGPAARSSAQPPMAVPSRSAPPIAEHRKPSPKPMAAAPLSAGDKECAQVFQRISLGENNPELLSRARNLGCR